MHISKTALWKATGMLADKWTKTSTRIYPTRALNCTGLGACSTLSIITAHVLNASLEFANVWGKPTVKTQ